MYNDQIRIHAGVISKLMDNTAGLTLIELKEKSKLSDKELYLAIGWLVSEKKIIYQSGTDGDKLFLNIYFYF